MFHRIIEYTKIFGIKSTARQVIMGICLEVTFNSVGDSGAVNCPTVKFNSVGGSLK